MVLTGRLITIVIDALFLLFASRQPDKIAIHGKRIDPGKRLEIEEFVGKEIELAFDAAVTDPAPVES